jgi:hypothetical protein
MAVELFRLIISPLSFIAGGLLNTPRGGRPVGNPVLAGADTFGLPPRRTPGSVLRSQVAEACVAALVEPAAEKKVVELVAETEALKKGWAELYAGVD